MTPFSSAHSQVIAIGDVLISSALLTERFVCDLTSCKGECCVEGSSGAPLEEHEIEILKQEYDSFAPFMTPQGKEAVRQQGVALLDSDGDWVTPLVAGIHECAYARFTSVVSPATSLATSLATSPATSPSTSPLALSPSTSPSSVCVCAIESAFFQGKTTFRKPISCWLYPIRLQPLSTGCALNVHCWHLCASARTRGKKESIPLYRFLKEPLIAKFGADFYAELEIIAQVFS